MGKDTSIEWCHHTFNPWRGCTKISPGCAHCYAETMSKRNPKILGVWGDNGTRVIASEAKWREPLAWDKEAAKAGERRRVFCASLADVFEDREELDEPRRRLARLIWETQNLDWLLLTKRPEYAKEMIYRMWFPDAAWPKNYWLGVSVENQEQADKRIPVLLDTPAKIRFLSIEPLLGPVDLRKYLKQPWMPDEIVKPHSVPVEYMPVVGVDWVIIGGESGPGARPCDVTWIRKIVRQCQAVGTPVFVKQLGGKSVLRVGTSDISRCLKDPKGGDPSEWPADLRVREVPTGGSGDNP